MSDVCKSCRAAIIWTKTAAMGKAMPVNLGPNQHGNIALDRTTVPPTSHYVAAGTTTFGSARFTSHFATCPAAQTHRKPDAAAPAKTGETKKAARERAEREEYERAMRGAP